MGEHDDAPLKANGLRMDSVDAKQDSAETLKEQQIIHKHSRSFSFATRFLPREIRGDVCRLYAWCRWCDNSVDEAPDQATASSNLSFIKSDIEKVYAGQPVRLKESQWLEELVERYEFPKQLPLDLIAGMESDLNFQPVRNRAELEIYCYRVAGVVGQMMCHLMRIATPDALEKANHLGMAMQMTNIARDVAEDWSRGRCYLPTDWFLEPLGIVSETDQPPANDVVKAPVTRLLQLAEENYRLGATGYQHLPNRMRLAIRIAATIYKEIGSSIARDDYRVMNRRHYVSRARKVWLGLLQSAADLKFRILQFFSISKSSGTYQIPNINRGIQ